MERQASYAFVGFVTLMLITALGVFTYWFIQSGFNNTYDDYNVEFSFPVDGLNKGAEVHFNGIKVGEVTALKLGRENTRLVIATVKIDAATPVKVDSTATLEPQGVTGLAYINISPGTDKGKLIVNNPLEPLPVIKGTESRLSMLLSGSGSVIQDAYETLSRVNKLLSDGNIRSFSKTLSHLEAVSRDLEAREQLLSDAHEAILSAGQAADAVTALAKSSDVLMSKDAPRTLAKIDEATQSLTAAAKSVEEMSQALKDPTQQLNDSTLPKLEASLDELDKATRSLKDLADEVRASPQGFVAKGEAKERKVSQ